MDALSHIEIYVHVTELVFNDSRYKSEYMKNEIVAKATFIAPRFQKISFSSKNNATNALEMVPSERKTDPLLF